MKRVWIPKISDKLIISDSIFHHLINVLKQKEGDDFVVFDSKTGEYTYQITKIEKKQFVAKKINKIKDFIPSLDVWLIFAPLKKDPTDFVIQKATELGIKKIIPVITKRVNNHNFNQKRAQAQAIEASQQCERQDIPEVSSPTSLKELLDNWDKQRVLCPLLERTNAKSVFDVFSSLSTNKIAILVGPEGGFSTEEKQILSSFSPISMGQRILRAETACVAAISCYQAIIGDFR